MSCMIFRVACPKVKPEDTMKENRSPLAPTLWRTFRVIASEKRLRCLKVVLKTPDCSVEQVAQAVGVSEVQASLALRALQARGLIASKRQSRWVLYAPDPDVSVVAAQAFLSAMKAALLDSRIEASRIVKAATAYTHPRRIDIVRAIAQADEVDPLGLSVQLGFSPAATFRHLAILKARGVVVGIDGKYVLAKPRTWLGAELLSIVLGINEAVKGDEGERR